ncbi:MAG: SEC-C metal-binding domain-containing protein [Rhizobiaceae bacterium]
MQYDLRCNHPQLRAIGYCPGGGDLPCGSGKKFKKCCLN